MARQEIVLKYHPRNWQAELHGNDHRFRVLVVHRRAGKTTFCLAELVRRALEKPNGLYAFCAPQLKQVRQIAWDNPNCSLKAFVRDVPGVRVNETEMSVRFPNGSRIFLAGVDDPHSLRGIGLDGIVLDEVAQMPAITWGQVIRPALVDKKGWAIFIGTPMGHNHFFKLFQWGADPEQTDFMSRLLTVDDTQVIPESELEALRKEYKHNTAEFEQEFYCSFEAAIQGAYYSRYIEDARSDGRITEVVYEQTLPVHTAWDLGISDHTAIWYFQLKGNAIHLIDYEEYAGQGLIEIIPQVRDKPYVFGYHVAPHDIRVRDFSSGKTRYEIAEAMGLRFEVVERQNVTEGINAVRSIFSRCIFDQHNCSNGLEALSHYREGFSDRTGVRTGRPVHDWSSHGADAFRYMALHVDQLPQDGNFFSAYAMQNVQIDSDWDVLE